MHLLSQAPLSRRTRPWPWWPLTTAQSPGTGQLCALANQKAQLQSLSQSGPRQSGPCHSTKTVQCQVSGWNDGGRPLQCLAMARADPGAADDGNTWYSHSAPASASGQWRCPAFLDNNCDCESLKHFLPHRELFQAIMFIDIINNHGF